MHKLISAIFVTAAVLGVTATVCAQDAESSVQVRFYDMGEFIVDGDIKRPLDDLYIARHKPKFTRLLKLQKSFLPKIKQSAKGHLKP